MADEKATQGQPFRPSARQWNEAVEAGEHYAKTQRLGGDSGKRWSEQDAGRIRIKNSSGADRRRGDVLEIGTYLLDDLTNDYPWYDGDLHAGADGSLSAILLEPIPEDAIGEAIIAGAAVAYVDIQVANDKWCRPHASTATLKSGPEGCFRLLKSSSSTGEQLCLVAMTHRHAVRKKGKPTGSISAGGSGTVTIWEGGSATSRTVTAYHDWMEGTDAIATSTEVVIEWFADEAKWTIVGAACA